MGPLEDALAEQRRRSDAMTAALRHARYGPGAGAGDDPVPDDGPLDTAAEAVPPPA